MRPFIKCVSSDAAKNESMPEKYVQTLWLEFTSVELKKYWPIDLLK